MPKLRVRRARSNGQAVVVVVTGALTTASRAKVAEAIWRAAKSGADVHVDLSGLTSFDSDSLLALMGVEKVAENQLNCSIDLAGVEQAMERLAADAR
jgi:ABC-type transporter Mla MlaB component